MMLKPTEHVGITIFLLYKQKKKKKKTGEIMIFRTFIAKFWIFEFSPIFRKELQFSGPAYFYDVITT